MDKYTEHQLTTPGALSNSMVQGEPSLGHRVSAIYPTAGEAEGVRNNLLAQGFIPKQIHIMKETDQLANLDKSVDGGSDGVLKDVLIDGAIGTAVGTGIGAAGTLMLAAANITLFVASPVIGPLAMLGWFAGIGGFIGAAIGAAPKETIGAEPTTISAEPKKGNFAALVSDAIKAGHAVLVVQTSNDAQQELAQAVISESLKGRDEQVMSSN